MPRFLSPSLHPLPSLLFIAGHEFLHPLVVRERRRGRGLRLGFDLFHGRDGCDGLACHAGLPSIGWEEGGEGGGGEWG